MVPMTIADDPAPAPAARRRPLERWAILEAAVELVDRHGLEALSMRALAEELGVGTMSLYHHVPNKEALLAGMNEVLVAEIEDPGGDGPWTDRALAMARSFREVGRRHPRCVPLLVSRPFSSEGSLRPCEVALALLAEGGFDPERAMLAFRTVVAYVLGFLTMESSGFFADEGDGPPDDLAGLGLPHLAAAVPCLEHLDPDTQFEAGLAMVFTGVVTGG